MSEVDYIRTLTRQNSYRHPPSRPGVEIHL